MSNTVLVSAENARSIDARSIAEWGFNVFALIEAAGRNCARIFVKEFPGLFKTLPKITVAAGTGNNAADAMVMLRCWILEGLADAASSFLVLSRLPRSGECAPWTELCKSLQKMKVRTFVWDGGETAKGLFAHSDIIVDGIAGTGVKGPLHGTALEMVNAINAEKKRAAASPNSDPSFLNRPFVASVDLPSGNSDEWVPGMPIVEADITLAIEPGKYCLYTPAARPYTGIILNVGAVFPPELIAGTGGVELLDWARVRERIPKIRPDAYKNERGIVELRAGSAGATGAALIAAKGSQAAGAGLVRLVVDDDICPVLASQSAGIMVAPVSLETESFEGRFRPDCILLGPGWGTRAGRMPVLEKALLMEKAGVPVILDADAIELVRGQRFNAHAILTPHPGEFSRFTGIDREALLCRPLPVLSEYAKKLNALIVFKGHVIYIASPDGRLGIVDGMSPVLAAGGSGDLLAGFCAAIAARMARGQCGFDAYACAAAAATLLIASAQSREYRSRFADPLELAGKAAYLAGEAWLTQSDTEACFNG